MSEDENVQFEYGPKKKKCVLNLLFSVFLRAPIKIIKPVKNFASEGFVTGEADKTRARGQPETQ